ncbi:MAG: putative lipid II flippase FtsW [Gammaproteobacteria bacterium]|nr:putative lipid II flippase FtsW [Gammaproteobacteria bacterium]
MRKWSANTQAHRQDQQAYDPWLLLSVLLLLGIGLVMVSSASLSYAEDLGLSTWYFASRHALYVLFALLVFASATYIPLSFWRLAALPLLLGNVLLLTLLLLPGVSRPVNGSLRWLFIGPISIQVSEITKLSFILYTAHTLVVEHIKRQGPLRAFLKPLMLLALVCGLLLLEPDFGAAFVMVSTVLGLLFLGGAPLRPFLVLGLVTLSGMGLLIFSSPYRLQRLTAFLDPWSDQFKTGYQLTQSLIAFGKGSWWGAGLGNSVQKLLYLPEPHTDFICAVLAEEWGFMGVSLVVLLFSVLVYSILKVGKRAINSGKLFAGYLAYGVALWIGLQAIINMGVNVGILPTKGLTLPFISYGGNSLVAMLLAMGIILRIQFELGSKAR